MACRCSIEDDVVEISLDNLIGQQRREFMAFSTETNANVIPTEGNVSTPSLLSRSHLSPDGGGYYRDYHRLGADGYEGP
jgi:hypothetical protein